MAGELTALAGRFAGVTLDGLPPELAERARQRLFDTMACLVAGAASPEGQTMRRLLDATPAGLPERIRYASGVIRSTEIDDIHIPSCTTVGSMVVPAVLLTATVRHAADADVLCALVAGYEAMTRLGTAIDGALRIYQGVWSTYITTPFAVAGALARLAGFDAERTANALGIAAMRCTGVTGRTAGPNGSRWFVAGSAAMDGWWAAEAAAAGLLGDAAILEGAFTRATGVPVRMDLSGGWSLADVDAKPFRTSRQALSATVACLRGMEGRSPADVVSVQAWVPGQVLAMVDNPTFPLGIQRQLALAIHEPEALYNLAHGHQASAEVTVAEDPALTALYPHQWGGRVEVRFAGGSVASEEMLDPPGSARAPFGWDELLRKHQRVAKASGLKAGLLEPALELCRQFGQGGGSRARALLEMLAPLLL